MNKIPSFSMHCNFGFVVFSDLCAAASCGTRRYLRKGFDALDAFLCHTWAVTVTGAPKNWAIRFVEQNEDSPRAW